ncbi:MAG: DUF3040 domain-containing protein [Brooklawnia sp.]|uniref:DUF3040 domain-containing protein n=1 Tax=Brooklawnia sp. TaxID=2699740 RepID=UPI003C7856BF
MALSEEEQRLLAQLEASLAADDPKLAQTLGSHHTPRQIHGRRAALAGVLFVVGLVLLIVGLRTIWPLSVVGFLAMFAATVIALGSWRKATDPAAQPRRNPNKSVSEPFMGRMEDRWRRRQDGEI